MWGIQPSEFWAMTLGEWWAVYDNRNRSNKATIEALDNKPRFSSEERKIMRQMLNGDYQDG